MQPLRCAWKVHWPYGIFGAIEEFLHGVMIVASKEMILGQVENRASLRTTSPVRSAQTKAFIT